jgi:hypothetical protein
VLVSCWKPPTAIKFIGFPAIVPDEKSRARVAGIASTRKCRRKDKNRMTRLP